jgi:tetratricopeptide (TPR) repeat protein
MSLANLGVRFLALGRPAEAFPLIEEAVAIRRELAAAYPDRYRPDLADSLVVLGDVLEGLNRTTEAERVRREAANLD